MFWDKTCDEKEHKNVQVTYVFHSTADVRLLHDQTDQIQLLCVTFNYDIKIEGKTLVEFRQTNEISGEQNSGQFWGKCDGLLRDTDQRAQVGPVGCFQNATCGHFRYTQHSVALCYC